MTARRDDRVLSRFAHLLACVPAFLVTAVWGVSSLCLTANGEVVEIRPALIEKADSLGIEYRSGAELVGRSTDTAPAGVELLLPGAGATPVAFQTRTAREGVIELGPAKVGTLRLRWRITQKTPSLVERTLEVTAEAAQQHHDRPAPWTHPVLMEFRLLVVAQRSPPPARPDRPRPGRRSH